MSDHLDNVRSLIVHSIREIREEFNLELKENESYNIIYADLLEALRELDLHKSDLESDQNECQSTVR